MHSLENHLRLVWALIHSRVDSLRSILQYTTKREMKICMWNKSTIESTSYISILPLRVRSQQNTLYPLVKVRNLWKETKYLEFNSTALYVSCILLRIYLVIGSNSSWKALTLLNSNNYNEILFTENVRIFSIRLLLLYCMFDWVRLPPSMVKLLTALFESDFGI